MNSVAAQTRETVYVLGCGSVGLTLAAYLNADGHNVIGVRTSWTETDETASIIISDGDEGTLESQVTMTSLSHLKDIQGIVVVSAKAYANQTIAATLAAKSFKGPVVILQNGIGVEQPFLDVGLDQIYRCVLYMTGQTEADYTVLFRPIASSPIGIIQGNEAGLASCVEALHTSGFPFHAERDIQKQIWKKAIINSVFNTICPLLDIDNGVFFRDEAVATIAENVVRECLQLASAKGVQLPLAEVMQQIMQISEGSNGQFISTLQDIQNGRETEIQSLNLELARMAEQMQPVIPLSQTKILGEMVLAKAALARQQIEA